MWMVWFKPEDESKNRLSEDIQPIVAKFPTVRGIAFINVVKGFAPTAIKEINNELGV